MKTVVLLSISVLLSLYGIQMDEAEGFRRQLQSKEKELSQLAEKLSHAKVCQTREHCISLAYLRHASPSVL